MSLTGRQRGRSKCETTESMTRLVAYNKGGGHQVGQYGAEKRRERRDEDCRLVQREVVNSLRNNQRIYIQYRA